MELAELETGDLFKDRRGYTWFFDGESYWNIAYETAVNIDSWPETIEVVGKYGPFTRLVPEKKEIA